MAMEIFLEDRTIIVDEVALRKAQAAWRGAVVRRKMKRVKSIYEDIFHNIEESSSKDPWASGYLKTVWREESVLWKRWKDIGTVKQQSEGELIEDKKQNVIAAEIMESQGGHRDILVDNRDLDCNPLNVEPVLQKSANEHFQEASCDKNPMDTSNCHVSAEVMSEGMGNDCSKIENETSVWESIDVTDSRKVVRDTEEERNQVIMELLWVQQAINSRKQYLRLKEQMSSK